MPTNIRQLDDDGRGSTVLRVDGQLLYDDAVLLEKIARDLTKQSASKIEIDIADVDYIDSEAASVLRKLQSSEEFALIGVEILLQNAVDEVERQ